jgi:uncharacterized surface protein with fasciclin (FAS1) repeats
MRTLTRARALTAALIAVMMLAACSSTDVEQEAADEPQPAAVTLNPMSGTIIEVATAADDFTLLLAALEAAGLVRALSGSDPFTVFAPTDAAFAALPPGALETLLLPGNTRHLKELLAYHVVPGTVLSTEVAAGEIITVQGEAITLATEGGITVNGANLTAADVLTTNGVIHVIDTVILPPSFDLTKFYR